MQTRQQRHNQAMFVFGAINKVTGQLTVLKDMNQSTWPSKIATHVSKRATLQ